MNTSDPTLRGSAVATAETVARTPEGRVASPCTSVCRMHEPTGLCRGCARTIAELTGWRGAGDDERLRILALLPERRALLRTFNALDVELLSARP